MMLKKHQYLYCVFNFMLCYRLLKSNIMSKKLTKDQLEKKLKYHEKRIEYYKKKIQEEEAEKRRIGFKFYY